MKKIILVVTFIVAGFIGANAQFTFGVGAHVGLPVGDAGDISSFVVGGELQGEYNFSESASGIVSAAYSHFIGEDLGAGFKLNYGAVPLLVGARYYPSSKFFVGGQIGYGFFTGDADGGGFAYKPQIGYNSDLIQVGLSYNAITDDGATISWVGLSAVFKLGGGAQ